MFPDKTILILRTIQLSENLYAAAGRLKYDYKSHPEIANATMTGSPILALQSEFAAEVGVLEAEVVELEAELEAELEPGVKDMDMLELEAVAVEEVVLDPPPPPTSPPFDVVEDA